MGAKMKNMLKDALVLFVITLFAGLLLGVVYEITKEPIAVQEEKARQEAFAEVFESAEKFETIEKITQEETEKVLADANITGVTVNETVGAYGSGDQLLGYCITVTTHEGYGGDIKMTLGVNLDGSLNGISILEISETPGLGMKAESVLKPQFSGKNAEQFEYTKTGAAAENQIDAISGATITTKAVTNAVNGGLRVFQTCLLGGEGNE